MNMTGRSSSRREFLKVTGGALSAMALLPPAQHLAGAMLAAGDQPMRRLSAGVHLFLDDWLIAHQTNVKRVIHEPPRLPEPIVTGAEDKNFTPYVSVLRDPDTQRFRMWYNTPESAGQSHIAYM